MATATAMQLPVLKCDDCGACCERMGTPPMYAAFCPPDGAVIADWAKRTPDWVLWQLVPQELQDELRDYYRRMLAGDTPDRSALELPCLWYDEQTHRCKHYEFRPTICREFVVGCESCIEQRQAKGLL